MNHTPVDQQFLGCIAGGAFGDWLGGPFEGMPEPVDPLSKEPTDLSDDTQLTVATCAAIGEDGIHAERLAEQLLSAFRKGRLRGIGASTLKALRDLDAGIPWALAGRVGEFAAGNGAAMRAAPLAFCLDPEQSRDRSTLRDLCRITHRNDEAYVGALAIVRAVRSVTHGMWSPGDNLARLVAADLPDTKVRDALLVAADLPTETTIEAAGTTLGSSGFVAESVPFAIFAAQQIGERGLPDILRSVIAAGGDTDTNASMAGQIAGAWLGLERIQSDLESPEPIRAALEEVAATAFIVARLPASYRDDLAAADYVWRHHPELLSEFERKVGMAADAGQRAKGASEHFANFILRRRGHLDDEDVQSALASGWDEFRATACRRVLAEHAASIHLNRCPACGRVRRTPTARLCLWCGEEEPR